MEVAREGIPNQCLICHYVVENVPISSNVQCSRDDIVNICSMYFWPKLLDTDTFTKTDISHCFHLLFCSVCTFAIRELIVMNGHLIKIQQRIQEFVDSFSNGAFLRRQLAKNEIDSRLPEGEISEYPNSNDEFDTEIGFCENESGSDNDNHRIFQSNSQSKISNEKFALKELSICLERIDTSKGSPKKLVENDHIRPCKTIASLAVGATDKNIPDNRHQPFDSNEKFNSEVKKSSCDNEPFGLFANKKGNNYETVQSEDLTKSNSESISRKFENQLREFSICLNRIDSINGYRNNDPIDKVANSPIQAAATSGDGEILSNRVTTEQLPSNPNKIPNDSQKVSSTGNAGVLVTHEFYEAEAGNSQELDYNVFLEAHCLSDIENVEMEEKIEIKEFFVEDYSPLEDKIYDSYTSETKQEILEENEIISKTEDYYPTDMSDSDSPTEEYFPQENDYCDYEAVSGRLKRTAAKDAKSKIFRFAQREQSGVSSEDDSNYGHSLDNDSDPEVVHDEQYRNNPKQDNKATKCIRKCPHCDTRAWTTTLEKKYHLKGKNCLRDSTDEYNCVNCEELFTCRYDLEIHAMSHTNQIPFQCLVCHDNYLTSMDYEQHIRESLHTGYPYSDNSEEYECEICGRTYKAEYLFLQHRSGHSKGRRCEICNSGNHEYDHFLLHTKEIPFVCDICGKPMSLFKEFKKHRSTHIAREIFDTDGDLDLTVTEQSSTFSRRVKRKAALKAGSKIRKQNLAGTSEIAEGKDSNYEESSEDDMENEEFEERNNADKNIAFNRIRKCPKCNTKAWTTTLEKRYHLKGKNCLNDIPDINKCENCEESFSCQYELEIHKMNHTNEIPFECPVCHDKYLNALDYGQHIRESKCGASPCAETREEFVCDKCDRTFHAKYLLLTHRIKYNNYSCELCGTKACSHDHYLRHTNEIALVCDICMQPMYQFESFRQHRLTHIGGHFNVARERNLAWNEIPYECKNCTETFTTFYDYTKHARDSECHVTSGLEDNCRKFECEDEDCGRIFKSKYLLLHHSAQEHSNSICTICKSATHDFDHYLSHTDEIACLCDICGKPLSLFKDFPCHRRSHVSQTKKSLPLLRLNTDINLKDSTVDEIPIKCETCHSLFSTSKRFTTHMRNSMCPAKPNNGVMAVNSFQCADCNFKCKAEYLLLQHRANKHSGFCEVCKEIVDLSYFDHFLQHTKETVFHCDICGKPVNKFSGFTSHRQSHMGSKSRFQCHYKGCTNTFTTTQKLNEHLDWHRNLETGTILTCNICSKEYTRQRAFREHVKTHTVRHVCNVCGKSFTTKPGLARHSQLHTGKYLFPCTLCERKFTTKDSFRNHFKIVHLKKQGEYACKICDKKFTSSHTKNTHVALAHTAKKSFKCRLCDKSFSIDRYRKNHERRHRKPTERRNEETGTILTCNICSKEYTRQRAFREHVKTHTVKYLCNVCGTSFTSKPCLTNHSQLHTGKFLFPCTMCDKKFRRKDNLAYHFNIQHLKKQGEYDCEVCDKKFNSRASKNDHVISVHSGEKSFQCRICDRSFSINKYRLKHERKYHRKSSEGRNEEKVTIDTNILKKNGEQSPHKCKRCKDCFTSKKLLLAHMKNIHKTTSRPRKNPAETESELSSQEQYSDDSS